MRNELQLVTSRNFDGIIFDCYQVYEEVKSR